MIIFFQWSDNITIINNLKIENHLKKKKKTYIVDITLIIIF